jgi:DHA1 family bicyclomycin/chloramphenicol resistance-like MFS transporter
MVSSLQGFVQTMVMTLASGVVAPLVAHSGIWMATGMLGFISLGYAAWAAHGKSTAIESDESLRN